MLGIPAGKGERAVASFDEDSVPMAVEASRDALRAVASTDVRSLLFATTAPPYAEKLNAALVGAAARSCRSRSAPPASPVPRASA